MKFLVREIVHAEACLQINFESLKFCRFVKKNNQLWVKNGFNKYGPQDGGLGVTVVCLRSGFGIH